MQANATKEHQWLEKLIGDWTGECEASMKPGEPPVKSRFTETVRSLGGLWTVAEGESEMTGCGPSTTIMTLGYDPQKKRYMGTFVASIMPNLWSYDGELDSAGKILTLHTEGPSMSAEGKMARYKDVIEFQGEDHRTMTSHVLGEDGNWHSFMMANYHRQK